MEVTLIFPPQWTPTQPYLGTERRIFVTDPLAGVVFTNSLKLNDFHLDIFLLIRNKS
jgi:hypothetical protein